MTEIKWNPDTNSESLQRHVGDLPWGGVDWESEGAADRVGQACQLFALVKQFRDKNEISCPEALNDYIAEAIDLVEQLLSTIGYPKEED